MTKNITDLPGLSEWNKYNGVDVDGEHLSPESASKDEGIRDFLNGKTDVVYESATGGYTSNPYKATGSISINEKTGDITIKAPKAVTELPEFKQMYSTDVLEQYSQAYKRNQDYKVPYTELDKDGNEKKTEVTIPEFIEKLNDSFAKENGFLHNLRIAENERDKYRSKYGNKVDNWSFTQLQETLDFGGKYIYLPDFLLNDMFSGLKNKVDENGRISVEDFRKSWYNRDKVGSQELSELIARVDSALKYGAWGEDEFENGDKNSMSAEQMARALNLKNYIMSVDPDAEWYQQVGDNIGSFVQNAAYGCTRVFANIANVGETVVTLGQSHGVQSYINEMDAKMQKYNEEAALANDATATVGWLGMIGGTILGTVGAAQAAGAVVKGIAGGLEAYAASYEAAVAAVEGMGPSAQIALTAETMEQIVGSVTNLSVGAQLMLKMAPIAEKAIFAKGVYDAFMNSHKATGFAVGLLTDTIHDALLYDSVSLRQALEASDQEVRDFWLNQLADNTKWWVGMSVAKSALKGAGKTSIGKTLNAYSTKYINKLAANVGDQKAAMKDRIAGGSLVDALEKKLEQAMDKGEKTKARRISNKINQTKWNEILRDARRELGNVELNRKSLISLTDESTEAFMNSVDAVKSIEKAIDNYGRNIEFKRQEMIGLQKDPSTGKLIYINPDLGAVNSRVGNYYLELSKLGEKYGLKSASPQSLLNQNVIDYMVGSYHKDILQAFVDSKGANAAKAADALTIVEKNVENAKAALPEEIVKYIDENRGVYTDFYKSLNDYGKAKGLVDVDRIVSYEENDIWAKNGYMPIKVEKDGTNGKWISEDGTIHATLEQEFKHHKFLETEGQHYIDPELVRQTRISNMARAEVNLSMLKSYSQLESATNIVKVSGEDTAYAKAVDDGKKNLERAVYDAGNKFNESAPFTIYKKTSGKAKKSAIYDEATKSNAMAQLSYSDTKEVLISKGVITADKPYLTSDVTIEGYDRWYKSQPDTVKRYLDQQYDKYDQSGFDGLLVAINSGGDEFEAGLQRAYLMGDKEFMDSRVMNAAMDTQKTGKTAFYDNVVNANAKKKLDAIKSIDSADVTNTISNAIQRDVEGYVDAVVSDAGARKTIEAMAKTSNGSALNARYYALKRLSADPSAALKSLDDSIDEAVRGQGLVTDDVDEIKKVAHGMFNDIVENELSDATGALRTINSELVNTEDIFEQVAKINDEIDAAEKAIKSKNSNIIMYLDEKGRTVYAETDPTFASLFNYRYKMDKGEASAFAKANAVMSKMFRYGTTSVNLASFGNQLFRDFGNALMVGGSWHTIKHNADNLVNVFGENIVEQIKAFDPSGYEMRQVENIAKATGQTIEQAAVSRELSRGAAISPSTTERTLYKDFMKEAYGKNSDQLIIQAQTKLQSVIDKYNPEDLLNGRRENYLRNRVFANSYNDAISSGYTLEQARTFAEFAMNNATTNFSRQLYHMQAIADSTPYFRAAINGTKSFWRMWSLDPVGITGRIMGGLILPTIYLTGMSVADPENRKVYMNIPEYQKENSLVFVVNGAVMSIPIPQEMSSIVAPFRQFTEYLYDSNKNDFWELMMNDALGFSPIDLKGFSTIDMNTMISEPTFANRINRGLSRVFSTVAPIPLKSAYMLAFKVDPYTGKNISNPSYSYWDDEAGEVVTMDYTQNEFAKLFSSWFGGKLGMTPALAEKLLSGVFGTTTTHILSDVTALCNGGWEKAIKETASNIGYQLGKPFSVDVYDLADSSWKTAVRQLTAEKDAILNSEEMKVLNNKLSQEKDPEKRKTLLAERQNLVNDYQNRVVETVKRLQSEYGGTYDRTKFAATIQLLNFNTDSAYQSGSQYSSDIVNENYWDGRNDAIHTMQRLGIVGTNDMSIFGYLTSDKDGNAVVKYSSPVAIMDTSNAWNNASDIHLANIKAAVSAADLWTKKKEMKAQRNAIYDKKKLTTADYNAINAIEVNWNADVMKTIAPYVESMTPEAAINNQDVIKYLSDLIVVPSSYKKDRYGRYVTDKKLGKGSSSDAYVENYIKQIFQVNDTGWSGGRNYSGRKSLGGK